MKSLFAGLALASTLFIAALPARAAVPGDVNADGNFDVGDVTLTLQIAVDLVHPTDEQSKAADVATVTPDGVYGDNSIDVSDATSMLRRIVGLDTSDPWPGVRSVHKPSTGPTGGVPLGQTFNLTVGADLSNTFKLTGGFKIQGKVTGAAQTDTLYFVNDTRKINVSAEIGADGSYTVGVPAGNYTAYFRRLVSNGGIPIPPQTFVNVPTGITVPVTADTTQDFTVPALPAMFNVHGNVTLPAGAAPPVIFTIQQVKDASGADTQGLDATSSTVFSLDGSTYSASLPAGTYRATFSVNGDEGFSSIPSTETFVVAGDTTKDLSAPALVTLSGNFTTTGTLTGAPFVSVIPTPANPNGGFGSSQAEGNNYAVALPTGAYTVSVGYGFGANDSQDRWSFKSGEINLQTDMTKDIVVPDTPTGRATLSGTVTGPDDKPITKGSVLIFSAKLNGADPNLGFSTSKDLTATGAFSASLPPGDYQITVNPDPGFPVATLFNF